MDSTTMTALLAKAKVALRITVDAFDEEIQDILRAAYADLEKTAGIEMDGFYDETTEEFDALLLRAVLTYTRMQFGEPSDYDRLEKSYWIQKAQLMTCSGYGLEEG